LGVGVCWVRAVFWVCVWGVKGWVKDVLGLGGVSPHSPAAVHPVS
jgi:hypothetical protein